MYLQTRLSIQGGDTANLFAALHFPPLPRRKTNTYIKENKICKIHHEEQI